MVGKLETWRYIVREWRKDGPDENLVIVTDGCTDNIAHAFDLCDTCRPRQIFDTEQEKVIYRNY
jgi:hypothetical protein